MARTVPSIFPACCSGRWPHVHVEVHPDQAGTTDSTTAIATSQVALPQDVCATVHASTGYQASVANLARISLAGDNVFGDDSGASQLATVTGSVSAGYTVAPAVGVDTSTTPTGGGTAPGGARRSGRHSPGGCARRHPTRPAGLTGPILQVLGRRGPEPGRMVPCAPWWSIGPRAGRCGSSRCATS
jgi:hypothetical protein